MRTIILGFIVGLPSLGILNTLWFMSELKGFLQRTQTIQTPYDLATLRRVLKHQMYGALTQYGLLTMGTVLYIGGWLVGHLHFLDIVYSVVPSLMLIALSLYMKSIETKVRNLPVKNELQETCNRIIEIWITKPLPDW